MFKSRYYYGLCPPCIFCMISRLHFGHFHNPNLYLGGNGGIAAISGYPCCENGGNGGIAAVSGHPHRENGANGGLAGVSGHPRCENGGNGGNG